MLTDTYFIARNANNIKVYRSKRTDECNELKTYSIYIHKNVFSLKNLNIDQLTVALSSMLVAEL